NSLVISNSGSMVAVSTFTTGSQSPESYNSLLLDTYGMLLTRGAASVGTPTISSNNTATIQGGAIWDLGAKAVTVGNVSGQGNSLVVGNNGVVSNASLVTITGAGNSLVMSGGVLPVSGGVTNAAGIVS